MKKVGRRSVVVSTPVYIGHEPIYPLQQRVAVRVLKVLHANRLLSTKNKRTPQVVLQPQCGKTGVIIAVIERFIKDCKKRGKTFQVVVLCGLSHLNLTSQTRERLTVSWSADGRTQIGAELDMLARATRLSVYPSKYVKEGIIVLHNTPALKSLDLTTVNVDERLIIIDEDHLGNGSNGSIDHFLSNHGIKIEEQIHTWDNSKTINHVVGVSATPFAHLLKSSQVPLKGEALFDCIYEKPGSEYNSILIMRENGRLRQTEPLFCRDGSMSTFFEARMADFYAACKKQGDGYLVIRARGESHTLLVEHLNRRGRRIEVKEFDADNENISQLNPFLGRKPNEPTIVIIRGSMRAGITIPECHHLRGWIETKSNAPDAQVQAGVGRACGYKRDKDTYPIYCDLKLVDEVIELYKGLEESYVRSVPAGIQSKRAKPSKRYGVKFTTTKEEGDKLISSWRAAGKGVNNKNAAQISSTQDNIVNDIAKMALEGRRDSGATKAFYINGPATMSTLEKYLKDRRHKNADRSEFNPARVTEFQRSYERLVKLHPEWVGKVVFLDDDSGPINDTMIKGHRDEYQKTKSALRGRGR